MRVGLERPWMPQAIKLIKIAFWSCLFLKVSGENLMAKGKQKWMSFWPIMGLRVWFFTLFSHSRKGKIRKEKNASILCRNPEGIRKQQVYLERSKSWQQELLLICPISELSFWLMKGFLYRIGVAWKKFLSQIHICLTISGITWKSTLHYISFNY